MASEAQVQKARAHSSGAGDLETILRSTSSSLGLLDKATSLASGIVC